jgi:hypothetical protein
MPYNLLIAKNKTHTKHTEKQNLMVKMFGLRYRILVLLWKQLREGHNYPTLWNGWLSSLLTINRRLQVVDLMVLHQWSMINITFDKRKHTKPKVYYLEMNESDVKSYFGIVLTSTLCYTFLLWEKYRNIESTLYGAQLCTCLSGNYVSDYTKLSEVDSIFWYLSRRKDDVWKGRKTFIPFKEVNINIQR